MKNKLFKFYFISIHLLMASFITFSQTNVALNKNVSSNVTFTTLSNLTDGNYTTNGYTSASASSSSPINITIDLWAAYTVTQISVYWIAGPPDYATNYAIQTSSDNISWSNPFGTVTSKSSSATDVFSGNSTSVRYVRMQITSYVASGPPFMIGEITVMSSTTQSNGVFNNLNVSGNIISSGNITTSGNITSGNIVANGSLTTYGTGLDGSTYQQTILASTSAIGTYLDLAKNASSTKLPFYIKWRGDAISSSALTILGNGNFGIGISTPQNKLDVEGGAVIGSTYSGTNTAPANGLLVQGQVGIGIATPKNMLDVEGGTVIGATYSGTNTAPANGLLVQGNVGIGTTSPSTALTVKGTILAGEVKVVDPSTIPADYVFENTYKLKSLNEVEQFISDNKHLPGVDSGKELNQNGWNMVKMENTLLQKVEELTLYVIEQNKRIEALEKENQQLKNK